MLTTYLAPTSGTALVAGFDICREAEQVRKCIGYLPETPPLYPEMSVFEYLTFVCRIKGVARQRVKPALEEAIERCALGAVRKRRLGYLSRGFQQRVGVAAAIVHKPPVIILDEPTNGLDPTQIIEIRKLIHDLGQAHTVILSTHILPEVVETCSAVIIIANGSVVAQGALEELTKEHNLEARFMEAVSRERDDAEVLPR
jgi:ABC-2 type transport system ATP-binding protein